MTKTKRPNEWAFDMAQGLARHAPTGLQFVLVPTGPNLDNSERLASLQAAGHTITGDCGLPPDSVDRRPGPIDKGDANAPAARAWRILVDREAHLAAFDALAARYGPVQARDMLQAICIDAGERWTFRARLERGWTTGQRAT